MNMGGYVLADEHEGERAWSKLDTTCNDCEYGLACPNFKDRKLACEEFVLFEE